MREACYGPMKDWRTFTLRTEGKGLREFKADWYRLYQKEGVCSDMIVCFKNGDVKLASSNIYWGNSGNPEHYQYYIDGQPARKLFSQISSVDMMHPLFHHPQCEAFWNRDENGAYSTFDFRKAKPVMDQILEELMCKAPNDRDARTASMRRSNDYRGTEKISLASQIQAARNEKAAYLKGDDRRDLSQVGNSR